MGKSPAKWIKLLFGKKTSRSSTTKGRNASSGGNDKGYTIAKGPPASTENSPVISEPVLVSAHTNGVNPELEKANSSSLGAENHGIAGPFVSTDPEKIREEQAAIKAQAVFRGFLARRAFRALKGIIRLQALVRGHLVRRQAVVTLHSMLGIIKLQALVRGHKVRRSGLGLEVSTNLSQVKAVIPKNSDSRRGKLYTNEFVCKLLSSSLVVIPLQIQYDQGELNSVVIWMERWTLSCFWKPPSQTKTSLPSKSQAKRGGYTVETESVRPKRSLRKNSPANVDTGSLNVASDLEKPKRNMRKATLSDPVQNHPQSELEKVKSSLRKVSSSYAEASERSEVGIDIQSRNVRKVPNSPSEPPEQRIDDPLEKMNKDISLAPALKPHMETVSNSVPSAVHVEPLVYNLPASEPKPDINKQDSGTVLNGEVSVKDEQTCNANRNNNKRRSSFSARSAYTENGTYNIPTLPSYMQATESAKAKLRGESSPRLGSDSAEKNGIARRHSLPSSTNGKVTLHSPRTPKILQASAKGGIKSDRSLLSSRDGNEKLIQVDWRR